MASSTAVAGGAKPALRRTVVAESSESSAAVSPADSPRPSASSTSLSSLSEMDIEKPAATYGKLIDTYGNEFTPPDYTIKDIRDAIPKHCFERPLRHRPLGHCPRVRPRRLLRLPPHQRLHRLGPPLLPPRPLLLLANPPLQGPRGL
ncbi:hypothetical protein PWT90_11156 [Aphanocladium album]|nr:hypothetical protein PWT90_11156 [Aphanocladium album]